MPTIFGPTARDQNNPAVNPSRLVNLFREPVMGGGISSHILRSAQGMKLFRAAPELFCRDMIDMNGVIYAVIGSGLYRVSDTTTKVASLHAAPAEIARNGDLVTVVSGDQFFVWDGEAVETPTGAITDFGSVTYLAGRTVLSEANGTRFQWSDIADPKTLPGLNFASAEQRDDKLLRVMAVNGVLMCLGERSTEIWAPTNAGAADAFALIPGAVLDTGIKARALAVAINGGAFLVGSDGVAYVASGTTWEPVSTPAVNAAVDASEPQRCVYWEHAGHKFAAITFRSRLAWVFDLATKEWFERGLDGDWPIACSCGFNGDWVFGGDDGAIYAPVLDGTDFGRPMVRQATSGLLYDAGNYRTLSEIEFNASYGAQDIEASLALEISRDGVRWGEPRVCSVGKAGDYSKRAIFRRLGAYRKWAFRLTLTDACDFALYSDANLS